jgi:hypothetical protein
MNMSETKNARPAMNPEPINFEHTVGAILKADLSPTIGLQLLF